MSVRVSSSSSSRPARVPSAACIPPSHVVPKAKAGRRGSASVSATGSSGNDNFKVSADSAEEVPEEPRELVDGLKQLAKREVRYLRRGLRGTAKKHQLLVSNTKRFPDQLRRAFEEVKALFAEDGDELDKEEP